MARSLPVETLDVLANATARGFLEVLTEAGGEAHDMMTVLTAMAARVIALTLPEHADAQTVEMLARMTGEMLALRRQIDTEDRAVLQ